MSAAARSVFWFGIYLALLGTAVLLSPPPLARLLGVSPDDGWVKVLGMMLLLIGWMDVRAARAELTEFFRISIEARLAVPVFFGAFVVVGWAEPFLLAFAAVDVAGAAWTAHALRSSPRTNRDATIAG